jgi:hypothetical protein
MKPRAALMGYFSTFGDLECLEIVHNELKAANIPCDIIPYSHQIARAISGSILPADCDPDIYSHLIVICGPCSRETFPAAGIDLRHFGHCLRIGVNLTMISPVDQWNPFNILIERDSDKETRPDLSLLAPAGGTLPVLGLILAPSQDEYGARQLHERAESIFEQWLRQTDVAVVNLDTRWPHFRNSSGLGSASELFSVIQRLDLVLTTRMHGMLYGLKAGRPVIAVDPISGGDKVLAQARTLNWPAVITADELSPAWLEEKIAWCLSAEGRNAASDHLEGNRERLKLLGAELSKALASPVPAAPEKIDADRPPQIGTFKRFRRALRARLRAALGKNKT